MSNNELTLTADKKRSIALKIITYTISILLTIMLMTPFFLMIKETFIDETIFVKGAGDNRQIIVRPREHMMTWKEFLKLFDAGTMNGFKNSVIVTVISTILCIYCSALTAYAITAYEWKLRDGFFSFIMGVMMIPGQVTSIGFYQMCYKLGLTNNLLMLILPSIAAPMMVFFMRQYLQASLSIEIVESSRIDGAGEFYTFNKIVLPIMKPAMATQAIFTFVGSWNNLFTPLILLTKKENYTMPVMVSLLKGDIYKTEYGSIYLGLSLTVLPLVIVYLLLSRYIVAGVALGAVKG